MILSENKHGNGAIHSPIKTKIRRIVRSRVGRSSIPFNWSVGVDSTKGLDIPIKDQGQSSSCGGQSASYAIAIALALSKPPYKELSAKSIYSDIVYPGGGTTTGAIEKQVINKGVADEALVPSQPPTEANLTDRSWENQTNVINALEKAGWRALSVGRDIESFAEAIRDYGFVIMEITGQNGNNPSWLSPYPQPPQKGNPNPLWHHFVCCVSARIVNGFNSIDFINSWGDQIGFRGHQFITQEYFDSGYIIDAFTFERNILPPKPQDWWSIFVNALQRLFS